MYALYECPVEYRSCTCAGIKEDILSGAAVYSLYVACRLDSKSFDDRPVGKLAQIMDICLIFASVELAYVNCAAVQQTGNVFRISSTNTPTAFMFGLSNRFKFAAFSGVIYRLLFEAKTNPIYSGFSSFAVSMSQGRGKTAELDLCHNTPRSSASLAFLSGARINVSPISTASAPISRSFATSSALLTPLSETNNTSRGISSLSLQLLSVSTEKSFRLRLLTPMIRAPHGVPCLFHARRVPLSERKAQVHRKY